ncbi:MAG: hypothetical protein OEZ01_16675 [Candidatus Heimdallarchaeota archaeon]|nr:hypothetical protein [Candidatus Heimdallarchaeota archaeon]MDH5647648.1 hypothetical protein [Candidatus Heimdallarchaeota archaeon]
MNSINEGLKDLFIMRDSGECVYHKNFVNNIEEKLEFDGSLMSSFLTAIESFSCNVDQGAKMLETANYRFVYHRKGEYIYVARVENKTDPSKISHTLSNISTGMLNYIPTVWTGSVESFKNVDSLLEKQLINQEYNRNYEITGKSYDQLNGNEAKIYSFLRFKGRSSLGNIIKLMKIPEQEAINITNKLVEEKFLNHCS